MTTFTAPLTVKPIDSDTNVATIDSSGNASLAGNLLVSGGISFYGELISNGTATFANLFLSNAVTTVLSTSQGSAVMTGSYALALIRINVNSTVYAIPVIRPGTFF